MSGYLDLIMERRRCLEQRCDYRRAELMDAANELHGYWLPVERAVRRVKYFVGPSMLVGAMSLRWLSRVPRLAGSVFRTVRWLVKARSFLPRFKQ